MRYFDNQYLAQYLDQGRELMVFVNGDFLELSSLGDLQDPITGVGYDSEGGMHKFNYKDIEKIKSGAFYLDMAGLTKQLDTYEDPEAAAQEPEAPKGKAAAKPEEPEVDAASKPDDEEALKETKFSRRSHSIEEKVDYWPTIRPKKEISLVTNSLVKVTKGDYAGMIGMITESSELHKVIRATNKGTDWTWGSTVVVAPDDVTM